MATLAYLAGRFANAERPAGNLLDADGVLAQAVAAASFYAGYAQITSRIPDPLAVSTAPPAPIGGATEISESEWALIRPLFVLYVERETACQLESARGFGMDVYGRSSSEVSSDIMQTEMELPHRAFVSLVVTV